jgi:hypothetical protein
MDNMYSDPCLIQDHSTESTDALSPEPFSFFAPPPQHTDAPPPDDFDEELDQDLGGLDPDFPFVFSPAFYQSIPTISTPSALTYSTDEISSYYSSDFTQSDYSIPSEIDSTLNNGLYEAHVSIHPAVFSNDLPSIQPHHPAEAQFDFRTSDLSPNICISPEDLSIAMQPPTSVVPIHTAVFSNDLPSIQPQALHSAEAQFDFGTSDFNVCISSEDLSTAMQPPTSVVPTPLAAHVTPDSEDSEAQMAPASDDRPFKCPLSGCLHGKIETI